MTKARILIIDDDPMVTGVLEAHLSGEGHDVTVMHMGEAGFNFAIRSHPDLILLDVMLPDATGFQMLGRFRENSHTHATPVIMMSGTAQHANQQMIGKSMGADAYVLKPFNVIDVGNQVQKLIKVHAPAAPMPSPLKERAPEPLPEPFVLKPLFNPTPAPEPEPEPESKSDPVPEPEPVFETIEPFIEKAKPAPPQPAMPEALPLHWKFTLSLFTAHILMTMATSHDNAIHAGALAAGGWALLLGWMVIVCTALRMTLGSEEAIRILGLGAVPIVLRSIGIWAGYVQLPKLPVATYWLRPLDLFEIVAVMILGILFAHVPRSSVVKSIFAAALLALAWCLTARGYFQPF